MLSGPGKWMAISALNLLRFFEPHDLQMLATSAPPRKYKSLPCRLATDVTAGTEIKQVGKTLAEGGESL